MGALRHHRFRSRADRRRRHRARPDYEHYRDRQLAPGADGLLNFLHTSFAGVTTDDWRSLSTEDLQACVYGGTRAQLGESAPVACDCPKQRISLPSPTSTPNRSRTQRRSDLRGALQSSAHLQELKNRQLPARTSWPPRQSAISSRPCWQSRPSQAARPVAACSRRAGNDCDATCATTLGPRQSLAAIFCRHPASVLDIVVAAPRQRKWLPAPVNTMLLPTSRIGRGTAIERSHVCRVGLFLMQFNPIRTTGAAPGTVL